MRAIQSAAAAAGMASQMRTAAAASPFDTTRTERAGRARTIAIPLIWLAAMPTAFAGSSTVCNDGTIPLYYTTIVERGDGIDLSCELSRRACHIEVEGWYELKPGDCNALVLGTRWETYLGIYYHDDGTLVPARFAVRPAFFQSREPGTSAIKRSPVCGRFDEFSRRYNGTLDQVLDASSRCANNDTPIELNFGIRTEPRTNFTIHLK